MRHVVHKLACAASLIAASISANRQAFADDTLAPPEVELRRAVTDLSNIDDSIKSIVGMNDRYGLGAQKVIADRLKGQAQSYYEANDCAAAAESYEAYIDTIQVEAVGEFLTAYYRIGRCREEARNFGAAFAAFSGYLSAFLSSEHRNTEDLLDVLHRLVNAALEINQKRSDETRKLLSSLIAIDFPDVVKAKVLYLAASTLAALRDFELATTWLEQGKAIANSPDLSSKIQYVKGLIAIYKNDLVTAREMFEDSLVIAPEGAQLRDLSHLALARIAVRNGHFQMAAEHYEKVKPESFVYQDAVYEQVFVNLKANNPRSAQAKAQFYLAKFPQGSQAINVRRVLALIDFRAGDYNEARSGMRSVNQSLVDLSKAARVTIAGKTTVQPANLYDLVDQAATLIDVPEAASESVKLFRKLEDIELRLGAARSHVTAITLTVGSAPLEEVYELWPQKLRQFAGLGDRLLEVGHRLLATEKVLHASKLSDLDSKKLQASESLRLKKAAQGGNVDVIYKHWRELAKSYENYEAIRKLQRRALVAAAQARGENMEDEQKKLIDLLTQIHLVNEQARDIDIRDLRSLTPEAGRLQEFQTLSAILYEEQKLLSKYRTSQGLPGEYLTHAELRRAWQLWIDLARALMTNANQTYAKIDNAMLALVKKLTKFREQIAALRQEASQLRQSISSTLGNSGFLVNDKFQREIDLRMSRHGKWDADMEWMTYLSNASQRDGLRQTMAIERELMEATLKEIQSGVLAKWPN